MESLVKKLKQSMTSRSSRNMKEKDTEEERRFLKNGSRFLKEPIADCNGKSVPIRNFSSSQILQATSKFSSSCLVRSEWDNKGYKGTIEGKSYLIKRFFDYTVKDRRVGEAYNDIVFSARMSNHSNFLKLFGSCFEFSFPVFVFEYAEHGVLNHRGRIMVNGQESALPLSLKLKIGKEIANVVTYLHMAFPKIIIHRDINPTNIFLDNNWTATCPMPYLSLRENQE
ncbi:unnamed protein product [Eruca vesicaria subsp. sativa]|uniref:Protein kinase domain-containing protein n=1 Tax=Eruca vesicaria subsp. sativa TaxID=29727 RepID=A0ABC8JLB8_ERUVS|nr:unnamed protein product [Eruca vesicaria subsp. sativa]